MFLKYFDTPLGRIKLTYRKDAITGLSFCEGNQTEELKAFKIDEDSEILQDATRWITCYFKGMDPGETPPLSPEGTPFQLGVWEKAGSVPFGTWSTYGTLASNLPKSAKGNVVSSQAVGTALSKNPILLMIPCHRIVPKTGGVGGYAAGNERKIALLRLEYNGLK